jgi:phospholipid/cholesterol/gamma-HCH transport system ATP-binding protein
MQPASTDATSDRVLEVEGVTLSFPGNQVLRGIDLVVRRGETFALLGASGSGKTVLLRAILGLDHPDGGTIRLFGRDIAHLSDTDWEPLRRRMSVVFQGGALYGALSVAENVALVPRELLELSEGEIALRVEESLRAVGLGDVDRNLVPASLSGGMRKRLAVARAIATHPDLILYDEPTSGLDPFNSSLVLSLIRRLHDERGVTSVVVTHDVQGACSIADHIGVLVGGRLVFLGSPAELIASKHPDVLPFLRLAGIVAASPQRVDAARPPVNGPPSRRAPARRTVAS